MIVRDDEPDDLDDEADVWGDDPDEDTTDDCPHCGRGVYDDAERCPWCGMFLPRGDAPRRQPWWVVLGVTTCLAMVTWWILHP